MAKEKKKQDSPLEEKEQDSSQKDVVSIKKADLDKVFDRMERQQKEIDMLVKSADKARLAKVRAEEQGGEALISRARIWRFGPDNKVVVGKKMTSNIAEVINGKYVEDQRVIVIYEDGKTEETSLINFERNVDRNEKGEIISRESNKNSDEVMLTIQLEDGHQVKISDKYIN